MRLRVIERYIILVVSLCILFIIGGIHYTFGLLDDGIRSMIEAAPIMSKFFGINYYLLIIFLVSGLIFVAVDNYKNLLTHKRYMIIHFGILFSNIGVVLLMLFPNGVNHFSSRYIDYYGLFKLYYRGYHEDINAKILCLLIAVLIVYFTSVVGAVLTKKEENVI